jgi:hypothetical protein
MLHRVSICFNDCYTGSRTYTANQSAASCSKRTDPTVKSAVVIIQPTGLTSKLPHAFMCGSENKQLLFHCTTLTDWFL